MFSNYLDNELGFFGDQTFIDNLVDNEIDLNMVKAKISIELARNGLSQIPKDDLIESIKEVGGIILVERGGKPEDLYKDIRLGFQNVLAGDINDFGSTLITKKDDALLFSEDGAKVLSNLGLGSYFVEKYLSEKIGREAYDDILDKQKELIGLSYESLRGSFDKSDERTEEIFSSINNIKFNSFILVAQTDLSVDDFLSIDQKSNVPCELYAVNKFGNESEHIADVKLKGLDFSKDLSLFDTGQSYDLKNENKRKQSRKIN